MLHSPRAALAGRHAYLHYPWFFCGEGILYSLPHIRFFPWKVFLKCSPPRRSEPWKDKRRKKKRKKKRFPWKSTFSKTAYTPEVFPLLPVQKRGLGQCLQTHRPPVCYRKTRAHSISDHTPTPEKKKKNRPPSGWRPPGGRGGWLYHKPVAGEVEEQGGSCSPLPSLQSHPC